MSAVTKNEAGDGFPTLYGHNF